MDSSFSIRESTHDDIPGMLAIEKSVHAAPWNETHFAEELSKPYSTTWLLTDDETDSEIAGYIVFWKMYDDCQILNVAVGLPFRGRGFAQLLIRKAIDNALQASLKQIVLDVRKGNLAAIQLYQKLHFKIQHVRKAFYSNGEDGYGMILPLDGAPIELADF